MTKQERNELESLLMELTEGDLSSEQSHRLVELMNQSPEAKQQYLEYCQMHTMLAWEHGLYGVRIDRVFFGESMFSRKTDASKIALVRLVEWLRDEGVILLDTQWMTDHLKTFGGYEVPADIYKGMLAEAIDVRE